jgi:uncharacterized protein with GYD domain
MNWTDQGVRDFKSTVERAEQATNLAEKMGGRVSAVYWTEGQYDLVGIAEFPDDETGSAYQLALASAGNLRTTTMRAYSANEMSAIIGKLG